MQTFLPYRSFSKSAMVLDNKRLGKQRVEVKQIYNALTTGKGWIHHPATKMWAGYEKELAFYGYVICKEWRNRGYNDSLLPWFQERMCTIDDVEFPWWIGVVGFHESHQSNLLRKDPEHYGQYFPDVPDDLPYVWPTKLDRTRIEQIAS